MNDTSFHLLHDPARLAVLHRLDLLDTPTEPAFDRLTRLATTIVQAPVALVVLLDADRQFFKSSVGLPEPWASLRETPLTHSFCQHALLSEQPLIVEDARQHPTFIHNRAIHDLGVVAYLGIPLRTSEGYGIGSFCVIDSQPRQWTSHEVDILQELAGLVMAEIEGRRERRARQQAEAALRTAYDELEQRVQERTVALTNSNAALRAEIAERKQVEAELSRVQQQLINVQEAQLLHLARELHDNMIQQLLGISYQLDVLQQHASTGQHRNLPGAVELASTLSDIYQQVLSVVKQLRGLVSELRPAGLDEMGLTTALEGYVARLQRERRTTQPEIILELDESSTALPHSIAVCLFRIAQEVLRNALQHAKAQSIVLRLRLLPHEAILSVHDDGCGFRVPVRLSQLAQTAHFGLIGIAERVAAHRGQLTIQSQPERGTEVVVRIPLVHTL
jgi:signal transduction histidine kinase